eukprot:m.87421 g.87421  ORF g.87421 m.87421 type:complete len:54 (-) comp11554_c0_seq1:281-442(-)
MASQAFNCSMGGAGLGVETAHKLRTLRFNTGLTAQWNLQGMALVFLHRLQGRR